MSYLEDKYDTASCKVDTSKTIRVTLEVGTVIEGDEAKVTYLCRQIGTPAALAWYKSRQHGTIPICSMETSHVRNALLKRIRIWAETLRKLSDKELVAALSSYITRDEVTVNPVKEFRKRIEKK